MLGECKWRNSLNETKAIAQLVGRAGLVPGYPADDARFILFTKEPVSPATAAKYADGDRYAFLSVGGLYAA